MRMHTFMQLIPQPIHALRRWDKYNKHLSSHVDFNFIYILCDAHAEKPFFSFSFLVSHALVVYLSAHSNPLSSFTLDTHFAERPGHSRNENNMYGARATVYLVIAPLPTERRNRDSNSSHRRRALCACEWIVQDFRCQREDRSTKCSEREKRKEL